MKATQRQVSYALSLLGEAGYSTRFMGSEFKALGARMDERSGTVQGWLEKKNASEVSELIGMLKEQEAK